MDFIRCDQCGAMMPAGSVCPVCGAGAAAPAAPNAQAAAQNVQAAASEDPTLRVPSREGHAEAEQEKYPWEEHAKTPQEKYSREEHVETPQEKYYREMLEEQRKQAQYLQMQNEQLRQMQESNISMQKEIQDLKQPKKNKNWLSLVALLFLIAGMAMPFASVSKSTVTVSVRKYEETFYHSGYYTDFEPKEMTAFSGTLYDWCVKLVTATYGKTKDTTTDELLTAWNYGTLINMTDLRNTILIIGIPYGILFIILIIDIFKKISLLKFFFGAGFTAIYVFFYYGIGRTLHEFDVKPEMGIGFYTLIVGSAFLFISLVTYGKDMDKKAKKEAKQKAS